MRKEIETKVLARFSELNYLVDETRLEKLLNFLEMNPKEDLNKSIYKIYEKRYSHTKLEKYKNCPAQYSYYYKQYIRSTYTSSPLFFGTAMDEAFNCLLLRKKKILTESEEELVAKNPVKVFYEKMEYVQINYKVVVDFPTSERANYFGTDFQLDILNSMDLSEIVEFADSLGYDLKGETSTDISKLELFCEQTRPKKKEKPTIGEEKRIFNFICWKSLRRKGHILLRAYIQEIYPEIEEVISVQKKILIPEICTETGKKTARFIQGEIDAVVRFVGEDFERVLDNKTSSTPYKVSHIEEKCQIPIYCFHEHLTNGAYAVCEKKLRKRTPRHRTQIVKGEVPYEVQAGILEKFLEGIYKIEEGDFPKNTDNCLQFGRICEFAPICKYDVDLEDVDGLVKLY